MSNNICRFIEKKSITYDDLHIINFVLETKQSVKHISKESSLYRMCYVINGKARLLFDNNRSYDLEEKDIFFTFAGQEISIVPIENFEYIYISFLGTRPIEIMGRLSITPDNFIFHNFKDKLNLWQSFIETEPFIADVKAECILLYTFSLLEEYVPIKQQKNFSENIIKIKKYIDENFTDPDLSLDKISKEFSYNKKYISTLFKSKLNVGFSTYLNIIRIQHSCFLMEQGITSVQDLAFFSGYKDPMYFSRIFKKQLGQSPRQHIETLKIS